MAKLSLPSLPNIRSLLAKRSGAPNPVSQTNKKPATRRQRLQWSVACLVFAASLNAGMYMSLKETIPTEGEMHFREEVGMLLGIQGYLMKQNSKLVPTMDSIRDVMFGPKMVGKDIRAAAKTMVADREKSGLDAELGAIVEEGLRHWDAAEKDLNKTQWFYWLGFLSLSLGLPGLLFLLAFPPFQKLVAKVDAKREAKRAAGEKQRQMRADKAKANLARSRAAMAQAREKRDTSGT